MPTLPDEFIKQADGFQPWFSGRCDPIAEATDAINLLSPNLGGKQIRQPRLLAPWHWVGQ